MKEIDEKTQQALLLFNRRAEAAEKEVEAANKIKKAEKIKLGSTMDKDAQMGPLNSFKQLEIIEKNIKATIDQGGKLRCGGKRSKISNEGYYFPPTIIECQNHNLPTAENELFGPVLSVMKFDTEEECKKENDGKWNERFNYA